MENEPRQGYPEVGSTILYLRERSSLQEKLGTEQALSVGLCCAPFLFLPSLPPQVPMTMPKCEWSMLQIREISPNTNPSSPVLRA